jgi:ATP-binding cassette, subfamily B, multidrug efflux pump
VKRSDNGHDGRSDDPADGGRAADGHAADGQPAPAPRPRDHHDEEVDVARLYDKRMLRRLLEFARPHRGALLTSVGLLAGGLLLKLAGPKIVQEVLDGPVRTATDGLAAEGPGFDLSGPLADVTRLGLIFGALAVVGAGVSVLREWLMNRTGQRIVFELRNRLFAHLLRLPMAWYDRHAVGWTVTRATSDVDALSELFTTGVATLAYDMLTIVVVAGLLIWISPQLSLVALLMLPAMLLVSFRFRHNARSAYRATRASLARMNAFLQERLSGLAVVRLFRRESASSRRFEQLNGAYYTDNMVTVRHFSLFFPTVDTLAQAVKMGCLVRAAWLISDGSLTVGTFVWFWMCLDLVFEPIRELAERYNILQAAMAAAERIFGILDTPTEDDAAARGEIRAGSPSTGLRGAAPAATPFAGTPAVQFEHVSFAYPNGPPVLQDVSFSIARGERVAVVGHTGAGKTTLVSLLCRFHETPHGTIRLHGRDVCSIPHRELRRRIAIVQQDVFLFSDTVAANIRMGDGAMAEDRVVRAAQAVHADAFVRRMPQGYESRLSERGANLSTGQRQLLAFARALAADPDVLVLDEATSSVDSETEALVEDATRTLLAGRTALVIAHRLSTVVSADRIVVLHKGRVHEEGTHDELLAARGLYWRLYRLHLAAATD